MTVTQFNRGQRIQNGHTLRDQTKPSRTGECPRCGHLHNETEPDHCLGTLNGVQAACCGHGTHPGYILFKNGVQIEGWFIVYKLNKGEEDEYSG